MGVTSINPIAAPPATSSSAPANPPVDRTFNRAVADAVTKLNDAGYPGANREVTFSVDQATRQPVIKVIDSDTKEVITQLPPKYVLALAAENTTQR